ncbi:hypothetical protein BDF20DRAFT_906057 [Mycotypha africana]|uniref:uncharacterized protein n=1 Tax=Mycotypha africana TaxID=64632 RepID=UPI0023012ECA|nr:uncharacterized protein BDF20DRAFT_906057 [Mycotypha africana]KAI8979391.1 hypothetical protein BDF20DRAFT_906057 [Mycotypha africana]
MVIESKLPLIQIPECSVIEFLFSNPFNIHSDKKILLDAITGESLTFAQAKDSILRFATCLRERFNFKRGDVLAIYSPNQFDYSVPLLGAVAAGGSTSPANPAYTPKELAYQLEMTKAKVLITHTACLESALEAADSVNLPRSHIFVFGKHIVNGIHPYSQVFLSHTRCEGPVHLTSKEAKETVAYLCFSSGTTGTSKGVMTTHSNIVSNVLQYYSIEQQFIKGAKDRMLGVLPFYHIFALAICLHVAFYIGMPLYVVPKFDLITFCQIVQQAKITYTCLVPPVILLLAKEPVIDQYDLSSLKIVVSGAAPLGADLSKQVRKRLPDTVFKQGYGLTETSPVSIVEPTDNVIDGSTGILLPNMTAKIVDENGKEVRQGERGEVWLKGPNVMKGYLNNPKATADCIDKDGYFHTGDVAYQDMHGHFYIVDRIKELIKYKGFQVPPAELEALLLSSPLVADCAVIGIYDHEQATELPRAYIVVKPGISPSEETARAIMRFITEQVVYYKQLRSVRFIDAIPKSASGKILRRVLRDAAAAEQKMQQEKNKAKL